LNTGRQDLRFVLYSELDFESADSVRPIVEQLMSAPLGLRPTHYGYGEADQRITDIEAVVTMAVGGARPKKEGQRLGGVVLRSGQCCESQIQWAKMEFPTLAFFLGTMEREPLHTLQPRIAALQELLRNVAPIAGVVYGEVRDMSTPHSEIPISLFTRLPDIPAVSIYGSPYISLFGEDKIRKAPFHRIERLSSGQYWLEAGKSVLDPIGEDARAAIRSHLGEDAFMSGGKRLYKTGRAPQFNTSALRA
jgi:hypothetical protein